MKRTVSKLVGVSFNNRQKNCAELEPGFRLFWKHEADNQYDSNAVLCYSDPAMTKEIGHLSRDMAKDFVSRMKEGYKQEIFVLQTTGGMANKTYGVNIEIKEEEPEL